METKLQTLKGLLGEVYDLRMVNALLEWDQQTCMPPGGGEARADQMATVSKLAHHRFVSDEIGRLLEDLSQDGAAGDAAAADDDACLVRWARYEYDRKRRLPAALVGAIAQHQSAAVEVWIRARADGSFKAFQPALEKMLDLKRQEAEALGTAQHVYDPLLQEYEPGMSSARVQAEFDRLRAEIVPLVKAIRPRVDSVSDAVLHQPFDVQKQREFGERVIRRFGYDFERGRIDEAVHPFCSNFSIDDVRITTRFAPDFLSTALFGTMHEAGHAMYEQGVSPALRRSLLASGTSMAIHESQSRLWENLVGRSRAFWKFFYSRLQATFPQVSVPLESFYRAINRVEPSFIRIEADELTYSLHIMLRFEIEREMLAGQIRVADLPEVWNAKMRDYLGITPPNDALGVLQDIHWSSGLIGYFPTYALGTIISVQFFEQALNDDSGIPAQIERGDFSGLLGWLQDNVYRHGRKYMPEELIRRVTGGPLNSGPYVKYLKSKFGEIYDV
jgi:carboxypeptidase Taq